MIPLHLVLPQDLVDMFDKVAKKVVRMHVSDARHAMQVSPKQWAVVGAEEPKRRKRKTKAKAKAKPRRKK